jgi:hypothetical protein
LDAKQKRSVIRTVRITKELYEILAEDAKFKRTSLNSLISSILTKYAEWDRYAEKLGHVSIPTTLLRALLDLITDEDALAKLADRLGSELASETSLFWFKKVNLETLLRFQSLVCKYAKVGEIEIEDEGLGVTFCVYHALGKKGSIWFEHYFDKLIRTHLKVIPQIKTTGNSVIVSFPNP